MGFTLQLKHTNLLTEVFCISGLAVCVPLFFTAPARTGLSVRALLFLIIYRANTEECDRAYSVARGTGCFSSIIYWTGFLSRYEHVPLQLRCLLTEYVNESTSISFKLLNMFILLRIQSQLCSLFLKGIYSNFCCSIFSLAYFPLNVP